MNLREGGVADACSNDVDTGFVDLGWRDLGSAFSAAMQMAALAAVVSYFWKDIRQIAEGSIAAVQQGAGTRESSGWRSGS
jgi:undecaprenyl pyrophosphate phosphatase UppP